MTALAKARSTMMRAELCLRVVSIVSLLANLLLATFASQLPDFLKGFIAGVLITASIWLVIVMVDLVESIGRSRSNSKKKRTR